MRAPKPRCSAQLAIARVFITLAMEVSVRIDVLQVEGVITSVSWRTSVAPVGWGCGSKPSAQR